MSVNSSDQFLFYRCLDHSVSLRIFFSFFVTKSLLIIPLSILIFYHGYRRWRRQRSAAAASHSDVITTHLAAMELNSLVFFIIFFCGTYTDLKMMTKVAFHIYHMVFPGEMLFHVITCLERYLAVAHPVVYRGLRQSGGVRIRTVAVGCVWLQCFGWIGVTLLYHPEMPAIPLFCLFVFSLIVVSFCSLCVLRVLIRPGPGKAGGDGERVDQSKQRAFHTVASIMGMLWLWFVGAIVCSALENSHLLTYDEGCVVIVCGVWCSLPASLVLPLLFLHRAGTLQCRRDSTAE